MSGDWLQRWQDLLLAGGQWPPVQRRRTVLILARVRAMAAFFAVATLAWIPLDLILLPAVQGGEISVCRVASVLAFVWLTKGLPASGGTAVAYRALLLWQLVPTALFLFAETSLIGLASPDPSRQVLLIGYGFFPFVMVSSLSFFPLTAAEGMALSLPGLLSVALVGWFGGPMEAFSAPSVALALLGLLAGTSVLAGVGQLHFLIQLVSQAARDGLTQAYTRRVGEELLEMQFDLAKRNKLHLTVAFIDLDDFKAINDMFGHDQGDGTLNHVAAALRHVFRRADSLVRWGGEEFVVLMPNTDVAGAQIALTRLGQVGLGVRPDGVRVTASIGVSERLVDACKDWMSLVQTADLRMYEAKQSGKDRVVLMAGH